MSINTFITCMWTLGREETGGRGGGAVQTMGRRKRMRMSENKKEG